MVNTPTAIRPLTQGDAETIQRYASDPRVARNTTIPEPYPEDGGEAFVRRAAKARKKGESHYFAILENGEMVGVIEIGGIDNETRTAQTHYAIAASHWGRGITTRAVSLVLEHAFLELGMETIDSGCLVRNPASGRVLEKNGFSMCGLEVISNGKLAGEQQRLYRLTKQAWITRTGRKSQ